MIRFLRIFIGYILLSYGMFYYAYKFSSPTIQGLKDYEDYKKLYKNFDLDEVGAPFNSRIVSSYGIYNLNKLGLYYDNDISYTADLEDKSIFFNALLFNYIFIVLSAVLIFYFCWFNGISSGFSFLGGVIFLFSFGTMFFLLNPLTEAFSMFLSCLIFISIFKKNSWYLVGFALAVLQREYLFFMFGLVALIEALYQKDHRKYYVKVLVSAVLFFLVYFILRKTILFTPDHTEQLEIGTMLSTLFNVDFTLGQFLRQTFFIQNLFLIYLALLGYKLLIGLSIVKKHLLLISLLFVQMIVIALLGSLAQTIGRLYFLSAPILVYVLMLELSDLLQKKELI